MASLSRCLAGEWARYGICVNAIAPGHFRTPLSEKLVIGTGRGEEILMRTPMKRFGELEELVGAAIFLASDAASFVTGMLLAVDGRLPRERGQSIVDLVHRKNKQSLSG